jgi:O-succinylbenzoic acid--CoA ligase
MFDVDFDAEAPQVLCHPDQRKFVPDLLRALAPYDLRNHFILFSSGTSGGVLKGYALSRESLFANAAAVNRHFGLTNDDVWGLSLPVYHVGGLSVLARARLLGNRVIDARGWNPDTWVDRIRGATVTTIVPTQLFDLVARGIRSPAELRWAIVGGDFLSGALLSEAVALGWPVTRTFGMSEVASQLASATVPGDAPLRVLPLHEVRIDEGQLLVRSPSLFTLQFELGAAVAVTRARDLCTPDGFYRTMDRARLEGDAIVPLGRVGDAIKMGGHLVSVNQLRDELAAFLLPRGRYGQAELTIEDDERKGKRLVLLVLPEALTAAEHAELAARLRPVKIDEVRTVPEFARTALGKLKRSP